MWGDNKSATIQKRENTNITTFSSVQKEVFGT